MSSAENAERARTLPLLTTSRARAFQRCPRFHHIRYDLGYRTTADCGPLAFGSLFHRALEAWWKAPADETDERGVARLNHRLSAALEQLSLEVDADPFDVARAWTLIEAYDARWRDEPLTVERVEAVFELELVNPQTGASSRTWRLAGKVDAIVRRNGALWLLEHKTSSEDISPGSPYWSKLRLDTQVSIYLRGAAALGYDVEGCIYDVIGKPALRPLTATPPEARKYTKTGQLYANQRELDETPEEYRERLRAAIADSPDRYFQRGDVVRLEDESAEAQWELWQTARSIRDAQLAERHPRYPDACFRWNRACDYFDVCTGSGRLDDPSRFVRETDPHTEFRETQ